MTGRAWSLADGPEAVMDHHRFVRDGSFWICANRCGASHPFPSVIPTVLGPCRPRRWGDGAAPETVGRLAPGQDDVPAPVETLVRVYNPARGPSPLNVPCRKCGAEPGERCRDGRKIQGTTLRPHVERLER